MRGARWFLLLAIAVILFGVATTYRKQKTELRKSAVEISPPLPPEQSSSSARGGWTFKDHKTGCKTVDILFDSMSRAADSPRVDLKGATLLLYHMRTPDKGGCEARYDEVKSATASYFESENRLYADGDVDIKLGEHSDPNIKPSLVLIKSSGVTFDTVTGHADTDRPTTFVFSHGEGQSTGATYDPPTHELFMKNDVKLDWKPVNPKSKPIHIESPSVAYHEATKEVDLMPTGKLIHGEAIFEGEKPVIHMEDDAAGHRVIREVDAVNVHGTDVQPSRKLQYSADKVWVNYTDKGAMEKIAAEGHSRVVSATEFSETTTTANRVDLFFDPLAQESTLTSANCSGNAVVESKPVAGGGRTLGDTHIMRSDAIALKMRPGGRDLQTVESHVPGTLEFLPNQPARRHRILEGREMLITYGTKNLLDSFHTIDVKTTTEPNAAEIARKRGVATTRSKELTAHFDPLTGHLASMEQAGDFTYQENDRKARAAKASLDSNENVIVLDTKTNVSDATSSTSADHIRMDQNTGQFVADGNVKSTRLPDQDEEKNSQMLSGDAPVQAEAKHMESLNTATAHRTKYEGNVTLWQGANRIHANTVDIDRDKHTMVADGNVVSELWDQPKPDSKKKDAAAVLTKVNSQHLVYTDTERLAVYTGGVKLDRTGMLVQSKELHAWLADSDSDSKLDRAVADGAVDIVGANKEQHYHTTSERAEFYNCDPDKKQACQQKLYLTGGTPTLVRTSKGGPTTIRGNELTYWPSDDSLLVNGGSKGISTQVPAKRK